MTMLECLLQISINSPPVSESKDVVSNALGLWLQEKNRRKLPPVTATATTSTCTSEDEELRETIITLTGEVEFLSVEVQDLEDEIYSKEQVFKKMLLNTCTYDSSDCENDDY